MQLHLVGRTKAACNLISQYLPDEVHSLLLAQYDLSQYEDFIFKLREEEAAQFAQNALKKPKINGMEPTKRKAAMQISRGVDKLKKVNTTGMAKLSNFFTKAAK